ncbi:EAL domain-containing protein [Ventrimonas sp. CLA-AP-H27]|uniref:EAL domain-containing protein n=1 Tax=Ventrimonas faecis TaxID=3133170 RepID=A0ABV1HHB9_9FIRM
MKRNKSILHLCEVILGVLMLILILNLYLIKLLVDPDISYTPMYRNLCLTLALLVFCMVLALIQRELLARLLNNAYRDVTGIHNKKSLEKKLQELNDRATTFGVGVMMFDLNNLKHVNDTYGHEKGDEFIQAFAYCLTRILDDHSFLARYGGDEFIIIQENTSPEELKHMDLQLSTLVQEYNTRTSLPLSYAVGFEASYRNHYFMMDDLINAADKNMYQDKFYKKNSRTATEQQKQSSQVIPTVSSEYLAEKIRLIQSQASGKLQIALISTDIENFHYINDKYGYPLGNEILNIVYEEMTASSLSLFTARFFSDVFISIADVSKQTEDALREQIQTMNQKICDRIRDTYHISFFRTNSGIYMIPNEEITPETMISCANVARRIAKKLISHTCLYSPEIDRQEKMQAEILHSFHPALENKEFEIYFQPKIRTTNQAVSSAEVLVRWIRDGKMLWSPDIYIPLFEQNGFVVNLDYYVYEQAFQWLRSYSGKLPEDFRISLNVSPVHFEQPQTFIQKIQNLIDSYGINPSFLTFEITESTYVNNPLAVNQVIRSLQNRNIQISMDDFGSGYSSLNTLKDLLFDEVKIDRMFLGDTISESGHIVLEEIFHMLKRMKKSIVCEGVETQEVADFLKQEGCDEIQGFLYYRPMCRVDFEKLMGC